VIGTYFTALGTNHRQALELFFRGAGNHLTIVDPGQCGGDLSTYLGWGQRQDVQASFARANAISVPRCTCAVVMTAIRDSYWP
jgi:hypothetical protein